MTDAFDKTKILLLVSMPLNYPRIDIREVKKIGDELRGGRLRDSFEVQHVLGVEPSELSSRIRDERPQIVHFFGHGNEDGELVLHGSETGSACVDADWFARGLLMSQHQVRCVILNACHSVAQAQALVQRVDLAVGVDGVICNRSAVAFTSGFYGALADGESVQMAFESGRHQVECVGSGNLVLVSRTGIRAADYFFHSRDSAAVGETRAIVLAKCGVELVRIPASENEFYLARTPVTNAQYEVFMQQQTKVVKPMYWSDRRYNQPEQPVVGISWGDAAAYCEWAGMVLPTEAQWEYACRAGTQTRYWSGDSDSDLARVGWYVRNAACRLHAVGEKDPNPWGLHDMHGGVWEWCLDRWAGEHSTRAQRGGSWHDPAGLARSAARQYAGSINRSDHVGFRPALVQSSSI